MSVTPNPSVITQITSAARHPRGMVKIGGNIIPAWIEFEVDNNAFRDADTFHITLALSGLVAPYDANWISNQTSMQIEVLAGLVDDPTSWSVTDLDSLIVGNVDDVEFDPVARTMTLSGRDLTSLLIDAKTAEKWINQTASAIATTLAVRHGLTPVIPQSTAGFAGGYYKVDHAIPTQAQTEWDLLCWLAQQVGFICYVDGRNLYFGPPPDPSHAPKFPIAWADADAQNTFRSNTTSIKFGRTLTVGKTITVTVRSWNQAQGKGFSVSYPNANGGKIKPGSATSPAQPYSYIIPNLTKDQAQKRAAAIYNEMIRNEMRLSIDMPATNDLDVMTRIPVTGTNTVWDQTYFPESIQRRMNFEEGYRMSITAKNHSDEVELVEP